MRRFSNLAVILLLTFTIQLSTAFAQSPKMFKYQTVVRNSTGLIIQNQAVAFKISLLQGSTTGTVVYTETQSKTTNDFGLVNLEIGNGTIITGTINNINWASGPYFIKIELDISNGTNYITMGTSELLSVPYALYAEKSGTTNFTETDPVFTTHPTFSITSTDITNWTSAFSWGNHIGLYKPASYLPAWGEITGKPSFSTVATSGLYNDLNGKPTLFSGVYADLTGKPELWDSSWVSIKNKPNFAIVATSGNYNDLSNKPTLITTFTNNAGYISAETQTLGLINDTLSISGTNSVSLQNYKCKWLSNGNDIFYNNGKVGINTNYYNGYLNVEGYLNVDTAISIYAHTLGGIAIFGKSISSSSNNWMNTGVSGEVETNNGKEGKGVRGSIYGSGSGIGTSGEAFTSGNNIGIEGIALSSMGNTYYQIGGNFTARGDWDIANGVGTGNHYGIMASANGGGNTNIGVYSETNGKSYTTTNYGGYFNSRNDFQTSGWSLGINAMADSSNYVNRGVEGIASSNVGQWNQGGIFFSQGSGHPTLNTENVGVVGNATNNRNTNYGVYGYSNAGINPSSFCEGVYGEVFGAKDRSYGVDGTNGSQGKWNVGVGGFAWGTVTADSVNIGMYGYANMADTNYAVYADAQYNGKVNYGIYSVARNGIINNYAGFFDGNVTIKGNLNVTGNISKASGTFKIDYPLDPQNKYLIHSFVESPDMLNIYSGNIITDNNGLGTVILPDYFTAANTDFRYQLTCIGQFAQVIVKEEIQNNQFLIQSSVPNIKISWQVTGIRNDNYAQKNRIVPVQEKPEIEKGTYLHPEVYGKTKEEGTYKSSPSVPSKPDMHLSKKDRTERMRESITNPLNSKIR